MFIALTVQVSYKVRTVSGICDAQQPSRRSERKKPQSILSNTNVNNELNLRLQMIEYYA